MNENVRDAVIVLLDGPFHGMRDMVALTNGNGAVDADVQVDVITQTHLPNIGLFDFDHPWDCAGGLMNRIDDGAARSGVHDFMECRLQESIAIAGNESTREK